MVESIKIISSFSILIPLLFGIGKMKTGEFKIRLFFAFLLIGFITDLLAFLNFKTELIIPHLGYIYFLYSFIESVFFTWIATAFLDQKLGKGIRVLLFPSICLVFALRFLYMMQEVPSYSLSPIVDSIYLITTAFLSGFCLLRLAETEIDILMDSWFWILSGIFFYSFGSFFIDVFKGTIVIDKIWPIRNFINIIQYGFFVIGLILYKKSAPEKTIFFN